MNLRLSTPDFKQKKSVSKRQKLIFPIVGSVANPGECMLPNEFDNSLLKILRQCPCFE